jgi:5-hydroxyisourate hydrolase-like protein (transthyretin family)
MNKKTIFNSLYALPNGAEKYIDTLNEMLHWIDQNKMPLYEDFFNWVETTYSVRESTVNNYMQTINRLDLVEKIQRDRIDLTKQGKKFLRLERNTQYSFLAEYLIRHYRGFREILSIYYEANRPVHLYEIQEALQPHFQNWKSDFPFDERIRWLLSLRCIVQVQGREYSITDPGSRLASVFPSKFSIQLHQNPIATDLNSHHNEIDYSYIDYLITELKQAATDSDHKRFEHVVGDAFEFLGFNVKLLGQPGQTDVYIEALIGDDSYTAIIDAKARHDGRLQNLDVYTLLEHQQKHAGDYIAVVAGDFANGKVSRHAEENNISLISVARLIELLQLHFHTPLNLSEYRHLFTQPGSVERLPETIILAAKNKQRQAELIVHLMDAIQKNYDLGLNRSLDVDHLYTILANQLGGIYYQADEIARTVDLLTHHGALGKSQYGVSLAMNRFNLAHALRRIADQIYPLDVIRS